MPNTKIEGVLEIQQDRGVIYFHSKEGECLLRIEGLTKPDPDKKQVDVRLLKVFPRADEYKAWAEEAEGSIKAFIVKG